MGEVVQLAGSPPKAFPIVAIGDLQVSGGPALANGTQRAHLSAAAAQQIVAKANARGPLFDITYADASAAGPAGRFATLAARSSGIWVTDAQWTKEAAEHIAAREYRYVAPVVSCSEEGEIVELLGVMLSNQPTARRTASLSGAASLLSQAQPVPARTLGGLSERDRANIIAAFGHTPEHLAALAAADAAQSAASASAGRSMMSPSERSRFIAVFGQPPEHFLSSKG